MLPYPRNKLPDDATTAKIINHLNIILRTFLKDPSYDTTRHGKIYVAKSDGSSTYIVLYKIEILFSGYTP